MLALLYELGANRMSFGWRLYMIQGNGLSYAKFATHLPTGLNICNQPRVIWSTD
jgi:hypothetical protein